MIKNLIANEAISLVLKALNEDLFNVEFDSELDFNEQDDTYNFLLNISMGEIPTDDGIYILPKPIVIEINYWEGDYCFITGEDSENSINEENLFRTMFYESALVKKV